MKQCRSGWVSPWVVGESGDQRCSGAVPSPQGPSPDTVLHPTAMEGGDKTSLRLGCSIRHDPPTCSEVPLRGAAGSCCGSGQSSALSLAMAPIAQVVLGFNRPPLAQMAHDR